MDCIFCAIATGAQAAEKLFVTGDLVVFRDIHPKAPVHLLVVPTRHLGSVNDAASEDAELLGKLLLAGKRAAKETGITESGYKLVFNVGRGGGQIIDHMHLHVLGGWKTGDIRELP